jgi:hypothetical protein
MERDRVTVVEAAKRLGISESAVRKRVARDQVEYDRDEDGRLYVYLTSRDRVVDNVRDELVNELRDRVAFLERELDDRKEEARRKDTIIAQLTQRIPAIEAPRGEDSSPYEPSEGPETATEGEDRGDTAPAARGSQEPSLRESRFRSWWRRNFLASMVGLMTAFGVLHANGEQLPFPTAPEPRSAHEQATATHEKPQALPPAPAPEPAPSAPEPAPPPPELAPPPEPVPATKVPVPATKPTPVVEQPTPVAEQPTPVIEEPAPTD